MLQDKLVLYDQPPVDAAHVHNVKPTKPEAKKETGRQKRQSEPKIPDPQIVQGLMQQILLKQMQGEDVADLQKELKETIDAAQQAEDTSSKQHSQQLQLQQQQLQLQQQGKEAKKQKQILMQQEQQVQHQLAQQEQVQMSAMQQQLQQQQEQQQLQTQVQMEQLLTSNQMTIEQMRKQMMSMMQTIQKLSQTEPETAKQPTENTQVSYFLQQKFGQF